MPKWCTLHRHPSAGSAIAAVGFASVCVCSACVLFVSLGSVLLRVLIMILASPSLPLQVSTTCRMYGKLVMESVM